MIETLKIHLSNGDYVQTSPDNKELKNPTFETLEFGNVGVEGVWAVLEQKLRREQSRNPEPSPVEKARAAVESVEDLELDKLYLGKWEMWLM